MTFENVMQSAKQLRKMTKFHFLDQNLNLPPPPAFLQIPNAAISVTLCKFN